MPEPSTVAIAARDLGIKYDLRLKRRRTMVHTARQLVAGDASQVLGRDEFWALQNVTFACNTREVLAVVGRNGSGKSTLLQAIAGVLRPDQGAVSTFGRSATLLTLGSGFERDLSGRENIFLNGAYLGFTRGQIEERVDDIIEFSELGHFIESPVSTYSKGMSTRLGFSIAVFMEPEILLLDEVLGVGDASFREKSRAKIVELMDQAHAIVVVSHSADFVLETATRVMWLEGGKVRAFGEPEETMAAYAATNKRARRAPTGRGRREMAEVAPGAGR